MPPNSTSSGVRWTDYNRAQATCNINATYSGATCTKVQCASSSLADADGDATNGCEKKVTAAPTTVSPTKKPTAQPTPGPTAVGNPCAAGTIGDCMPQSNPLHPLHAPGLGAPSALCLASRVATLLCFGSRAVLCDARISNS